MDYLFFIHLFTLLALGALTVALFAGGVQLLRKIKPGTPAVSIILQVLEPLAYQGIFAGQTLALMAFQEAEDYMRGIDRKAAAVSTYRLIPDSVVIAGKTYPVSFIKMLITLETWSTFVEDVYQRSLAFLLANRDFFKRQVEASQQTTITVPANADQITMRESITNALSAAANRVAGKG